MGDLIMTTPAIESLKRSFNAEVTVLTSRMGEVITPYLHCVDQVIVADLPWVKTDKPCSAAELSDLAQTLGKHDFDGAVIFTVFSQNPLPAAMLAYLAGIPRRVAYCRENPYDLLTDWIPDEEPYFSIQHQVARDIALVNFIGAKKGNSKLWVAFSRNAEVAMRKKMAALSVDPTRPYLVLHPGVSEKKREYPADLWVETGRQLYERTGFHLVITGSNAETELIKQIASLIGPAAIPAAGVFNIEEFVALVNSAAVVVSVNTGTVHIAAATQTPVVVLYALTNPQHTPWQVPSSVLPFSVLEDLRSKNQVIRFVNESLYQNHVDFPSPKEVVQKVEELSMETPAVLCGHPGR